MYCLAVFSSRNETLYLAKMLAENGFRIAIVNTPKEAGLACGISVKFSSEFSNIAKIIISRRSFATFAGFYNG